MSSASEMSASRDVKLPSILAGLFVLEKPSIRWSDVAGLESTKEALMQSIIVPMNGSDCPTKKLIPWTLLFGAPGVGKTHLARAIATEVSPSTMFFTVASSCLFSTHLHPLDTPLATLFELAHAHKPSIIFFDEVEFLSSRSDNETETSERIKSEFLVQMCAPRNGLVVLGATSRPWTLNASIVHDCFEKHILLPLPDEQVRRSMFGKHIGQFLSEQDIARLIIETGNTYSCADIVTLVRDAMMQPVRRVQLATHFRKSGGRGDGSDLWEACGSKDDKEAVEMRWTDVGVDRLVVPDMTMVSIV